MLHFQYLITPYLATFLIGIVFPYYSVGYASIHRLFVVIVAVVVVCGAVVVVYKTYTVVGQIRYHHSYGRRYNLKVCSVVAIVCSIVVIVERVVIHQCLVSMGQAEGCQSEGGCYNLIYTIYKSVEAAIVEVVYHTCKGVSRSLRWGRCMEVIVDRTSMTFGGRCEVIPFGWMIVGMVSTGRRCVVIVLCMRFLLHRRLFVTSSVSAGIIVFYGRLFARRLTVVALNNCCIAVATACATTGGRCDCTFACSGRLVIGYRSATICGCSRGSFFVVATTGTYGRLAAA